MGAAMIQLSDIVIRVAGRALLDGASVTVPDGARVGLVGRNGAGKTTLLKLLLGEIAAERGTFQTKRGARIGHVAQEAPASDATILSIVLAADDERTRLLAAAEASRDGHEIAEAHARLAAIGAHAAPARAARILAGLGFDEAAQARPARSFSGGWRMRVALAAMLFAEPEILLLDEPTNYLDLEGTLWLENHLSRYPHTLVIVSHDRDLLDGAVDSILHLDRGRLTLWKGNFSSFQTQLAEKRSLDAKAAAKQEAERKHLQAFVDRFRAKASKARQAQSRVKRLEKMKPVELVVDEAAIPIAFPTPARPLASPIVAMERAAAGYGGAPVLAGLDLRIDADDRIGLLGANGNGKSTFAKLISRRLEPTAGEVRRAPRLEVGYFAQHQLDELVPENSVLDHVRALMPGEPEAKVRGRAAQFGFSGERVATPVAALSGGEKARLLIGLATFAGPQLLVLDEPTNHLDIDARASLVQAINDFAGAVVLISHDRYLLDACADRLWYVGRGTVAPFDGDLDDYRRLVLAEAKGESAPRPKAASAPKRDGAERRAALAALKRRIEDSEAELERLRKRLVGIDALLADPTLYARDPVKAGELGRLRRAAHDALAREEERWLELGEALEADTVNSPGA
jgi:ATP-binding cassette subfamily F protein 3